MFSTVYELWIGIIITIARVSLIEK